MSKFAILIDASEDFVKKGIKAPGTCILTGELPFADLKQFEAEQYNRGTGRWVWFVT
jgi:hypothetical protein